MEDDSILAKALQENDDLSDNLADALAELDKTKTELSAYQRLGAIENLAGFKRAFLQSILADALKRIEDLGGAVKTKPSPGVDVVLND